MSTGTWPNYAPISVNSQITARLKGSVIALIAAQASANDLVHMLCARSEMNRWADIG